MDTEIKMLFCTIILGVIQLMIPAQIKTAKFGTKWNFSPRDEKTPELTGVGARFERSFHNLMETLPFFIAAVCITEFDHQTGGISAIGAVVYLACRVVYVPLYAAGIPVVRTLVWLGSMVGVAMILAANF